MTTRALLLIAMVGGLAHADRYQQEFEIRQAAERNEEAIKKAARIQAHAIDEQTKAINRLAEDARHQAFMASFDNASSRARSFDSGCPFSKLVDENGGSVYLDGPNGTNVGPLYVRQCK